VIVLGNDTAKVDCDSGRCVIGGSAELSANIVSDRISVGGTGSVVIGNLAAIGSHACIDVRNEGTLVVANAMDRC
jgi:hypothetical protein